MHHIFLRSTAILALLIFVSTAEAADPPSVKLALSFKPKQSDIEYDIPSAAEQDKCKVTVVRKGKASGWIVVGPGGETLRRFMDTDGDNIVDHWGYYLRGLEVYRDIDSDADNKIDQFRWLNTAGSRWGIDQNADGFVDVWKMISAEEASREAVRALISGNAKILEPLLITDDDVERMGIPKNVSKQLMKQIAAPEKLLAKNQKAAKGISEKTRWLQFINTIPAIIPAEQLGSSQDLFIYENAMATVETGSATALIQIGEMVRVGDTWKITSVPQLMDQNSVQVGGLLMHPALAGVADQGMETEDEDPKVRKLIEQLQALDKNSPELTASKSDIAKYYKKRIEILAELRKLSESDELRNQWTQQLTDGLFTGVQTGDFPDGLKRLEQLEADVEKEEAAALLAYVAYRRMLADYNINIRETPDDKREEVQKKWLDDLSKFVEKYPLSDDAPEAILQIAVAEEFNGKVDEALKWYRKIASDYPQAPSLSRAEGALRRIELEGKTLKLSGRGLDGKPLKTTDYQGKVLAVIFWASWAKPHTEELPQIRELYEKYHSMGFEIIGVNLDAQPSEAIAFVKQHKMDWPQIHEPGGLIDSPPAREFGILTAPTIFLVDRQGKVVKRNASVDDLKELTPKLLDGKTAQIGAESGGSNSTTN